MCFPVLVFCGTEEKSSVFQMVFCFGFESGPVSEQTEAQLEESAVIYNLIFLFVQGLKAMLGDDVAVSALNHVRSGRTTV